MMTCNELYQEALSRAGLKRTDPGVFDISCFMEKVLGISRFQLPIQGNDPIPTEKEQEFFVLFSRWQSGEPLQYILGSWEFYGLPFFVGPGVLIPRQDTETLAEEALHYLKGRQDPLVADVCSGSGCLACTIALKCKGASVYALELSSQALPYLQKNVDALKADVKILQGDAFFPPELPPLDLVVCNPPYLSRPEMETLDDLVKWEPEMALSGGTDGYDFYRSLPSVWGKLLKPGGALMFETGYLQGQKVKKILEENGFIKTRLVQDAAGIERVAIGIKSL